MLIRLHMFTSQGKQSGGSATKQLGPATFTLPYKKWKEGHILMYQDNRDDEWTIAKIDNADKQIRREDCHVILRGSDGETRELAGSTLLRRYQFKSHGDIPVEEEQVAEVSTDAFAGRTDVQGIGISVAGIREFYPRTNGKEGTRILMHDKTAYIVAEDFDTVWTMAARASASAPNILAGMSSVMREQLNNR